MFHQTFQINAFRLSEESADAKQLALQPTLPEVMDSAYVTKSSGAAK